ncbi:MAG: N-acetyltransferase [Spirochaetales bacterium]|nr:N-acetyltransferase [Leptospiraceae bacterium]MCP5483038.1 N-acetyltransferase [Spirochaetales bacterium]MCP5486155.1 N-acetyltransferase [Spirochaetales bacterium]
MKPVIEDATAEDLEAIVVIYNQAIASRVATGDTEIVLAADRCAWFESHLTSAYPLLVARLDRQVVGYAYLSPYRPGRPALEKTVEVSYYVHADFHRLGIASALLHALLERCRDLRYETAFAIVFDCNSASIALLKKAGFELWGRLPGVVHMDGATYDHLYYGRKI